MNLYFRLLKLLILRLFSRPSLGLLGTSVLSGRTWLNDLDNNIHMNNGRYLTIMDLGRLDIILCNGLLTACLKHRWFPIVGALKIIYLRPLKLFQKFELKTRIVGWDQKLLYVEQWFEVEGVLYAKGHLQGLFNGPKGKIPTKQLLAAAGWSKPSPPLPSELKKWLRSNR